MGNCTGKGCRGSPDPTIMTPPPATRVVLEGEGVVASTRSGEPVTAPPRGVLSNTGEAFPPALQEEEQEGDLHQLLAVSDPAASEEPPLLNSNTIRIASEESNESIPLGNSHGQEVLLIDEDKSIILQEQERLRKKKEKEDQEEVSMSNRLYK